MRGWRWGPGHPFKSRRQDSKFTKADFHISVASPLDPDLVTFVPSLTVGTALVLAFPSFTGESSFFPSALPIFSNSCARVARGGAPNVSSSSPLSSHAGDGERLAPSAVCPVQKWGFDLSRYSRRLVAALATWAGVAFVGSSFCNDNIGRCFYAARASCGAQTLARGVDATAVASGLRRHRLCASWSCGVDFRQ